MSEDAESRNWERRALARAERDLDLAREEQMQAFQAFVMIQERVGKLMETVERLQELIETKEKPPGEPSREEIAANMDRFMRHQMNYIKHGAHWIEESSEIMNTPISEIVEPKRHQPVESSTMLVVQAVLRIGSLADLSELQEVMARFDLVGELSEGAISQAGRRAVKYGYLEHDSKMNVAVSERGANALRKSAQREGNQQILDLVESKYSL